MLYLMYLVISILCLMDLGNARIAQRCEKASLDNNFPYLGFFLQGDKAITIKFLSWNYLK